MKTYLFASFLFLWCTASAWSQIQAIDDCLSAEDRISKYLLNADQSQDLIAFFYREQTATTYDSKPELFVAHQNSGIFIQSTKERIRYMSADFDSLGRGDSQIPFRYESFILNGREKRRFYDISNAANIATAKEVLPDPETGLRQSIDLANPGFFGSHGKEIEPLGLIVGDISSAESRFSNIDRLLKFFLSDSKFESELEARHGTLTGKWRRGDYVKEITFDDRQGGLPVLTKNYVVDGNGKATSDYVARLRSVWKEASPGNWVVEKLSISSANAGKMREYQFEFEWCDTEKLKQFFELREFKRSYQFDVGDWHGPAYELFFPKSTKSKKGK